MIKRPVVPIVLGLSIVIAIGYFIARNTHEGCSHSSCGHNHTANALPIAQPEEVVVAQTVAPASPDAQKSPEIKSIKTQNEFNEFVQNNPKPVAIKIFATWCPPCKKMAPHFKKVAQRMSDVMDFVEINGEEFDNPKALGIESYPTVIVYKNGKEISRISGGRDEEQLFTALNALL
jgi:thiol-disulfide isomerase/thioredoxin